MVVIITGASRGIGFSLANYFHALGHTVYGFSRNKIETKGFESCEVDVTDSQQIHKQMQLILQKHKTIDLLINNAGKGMVGSVENTTAGEIDSLMQLNLSAPVAMMSAVLPQMREQKFGKIINISSIGSEMGLPYRGFYSASKSALDKVTEAIRYEVKPWNIHICSLHLGDIKTDIALSRVKSEVPKAYEASFQKVYSLMNSHVDSGLEPDEVAVYIRNLLKKDKWKAHYYCGKFGQKIAVPLKWILPQRVFELLMRKYSNMD